MITIDEIEKEELQEMQSLVFSSEINLLSVHILLEAFYRGETILTLEDFIKGDYWKIDEIYEAVRENGDYNSAQDLVLEQVLLTIVIFTLGKVNKISVSHLSEFLDETIKEAVETRAKENEVEEIANYYSAVVSKICELKALSDKRKEEAFEKDHDMQQWREYYDRIDFEPNEYSRHLEYIIAAGAPFIEIEIEFEKDGINKLEKALEDYLFSFIQDDFLEQRERRLYFSRQLENFLTYINKLPVINGEVNVPFEVLGESSFEFVKIVSYLEREGKLKVRNWGDKNVWNIKFHKTPITIEALISNGQTSISQENTPLKIISSQNKVFLEKLDFVLDKRTGNFTFGRTKGQFNPKTQECKVLLALMESVDNFADYEKLIIAMGRQYQKSSLKSQTRELGLIIRNIKRTLGILPKGKNSNKDIFKNIKGVGYGLSA